MMGKQSGQTQMAVLDIGSMIPESHLRRQNQLKTALSEMPLPKMISAKMHSALEEQEILQHEKGSPNWGCAFLA